MALVTLAASPPEDPTIPAQQERCYLYLENPSEVDYRWDFTPEVDMDGEKTGQLLKAGERLVLTRETAPWLGRPLYFIAASGTPDLIYSSLSA